MGCDIHLHIELKVNGKWEHYSCPSVSRHKVMFAKMVGVDTWGRIIVNTDCRGVPDDISEMTRLCLEYDRSCCSQHSEHWLSSSEVDSLSRWYESEQNPSRKYFEVFEADFLHCYLLDSSFAGFQKGDHGYPSWLEDYRFVFWFDC